MPYNFTFRFENQVMCTKKRLVRSLRSARARNAGKEASRMHPRVPATNKQNCTELMQKLTNLTTLSEFAPFSAQLFHERVAESINTVYSA